MNAPGEFPPSDTAAEEVAKLRVPPKSTEAEQGLLGALMLDAGVLAKINDQVATGDFYATTHQLIFDAITSLAAERAPVDVISVYDRLQRDDNAEKVGGLPYLNALSQSVPSVANVRRYAELIAEYSVLRGIIARADEATTRAFRREPAADILDDTKVQLGRLAESRKLGAKGIPYLTLAQLRDQAQQIPWLIKHLMPGDSVGVIFGASQTFKSFVAIDAALHVARGLPWLGRRTKQGHVVYVAAEGGAGLWSRICAWHKARHLQWADTPMTVVPVAVDLMQDAWRVVEKVQATGVTPALIVVDTLSQTFAGEENSANEIAAYFRELGNRFRALWHCTVLVIHHSGHSATERPRGSSAIIGNVDWMMGVHRDEKEMLATLSCVKQKDGESFPDAQFALLHQHLDVDADGDEIKSLVAWHLSSAEDVQEAMERESRAGRGGNNHLLMRLLQNGIQESDLRQLFYRECGAESADGRRQAYNRARAWAVKSGFMEVVNGYVITLKTGSKA